MITDLRNFKIEFERENIAYCIEIIFRVEEEVFYRNISLKAADRCLQKEIDNYCIDVPCDVVEKLVEECPALNLIFSTIDSEVCINKNLLEVHSTLMEKLSESIKVAYPDNEIDTPFTERAVSIMEYLGLNQWEFLEQVIDDDKIFTYGREEYLVLTDDEADERFEDELETYIEDCIWPEIPNYLREYFDKERWKEDARCDGRGRSLAHHDGEENDWYSDYCSERYYIYRLS